MKLFEAERSEGERPAQFFARVDPKRVVALLADLVNGPPTPDDLADVGETTGFQLQTKEGECAA
jgi:hypothetical protein